MKLQSITVLRCSEGHVHILVTDDDGHKHDHQMPLGSDALDVGTHVLIALAIAKETTVAQPKYAGLMQ